ncbi:AMP-binding protein, partial [Steroidobacter sp.]|uniref:AMP-binding protein n=1 Tax=Steroidobacter sp. TaxID=1978227 RepID=UPI001A36B7FB
MRSLGHMTVGGILKSAAERFAEREALFCVATGRRFTFRQLNARSNRLANALLTLPLARRSVVAFICSNRAEIVETYAALAKSGLVGLPLNYRLAPTESAALINAVGAVAVLCEARFGSVLDHLYAHCPALAHAIWIGEHAPESCLRYEELLSAAPASEPDVDIDDQAPFYFNLTSGTTGLPKAYVLTQHSATAIHPSILATDSRADDVSLVLFPAFGRVGFGNVLHAMTIGTRTVLANFDAAE